MMAPAAIVLGDGPIERIVLRVGRGEIDLPTGRAQARRAAVVDALTPAYALALARWAFSLGVRDENPDAARTLLDVLLAATEALPDDEESLHIKGPVELNWCNICNLRLADDPDWTVYASGYAVGQRMLDRAERHGDADMRYAALHALGSLHLDPLVAHQAPLSWRARMRDWYERGNANSTGAARPFPPLDEAIRTGLRYFERAADAVDDVRRGRSLKAQVQALEWLGRLTGEEEDFAPRASQALALLDFAEDLTSITYLVGLLERKGEPLPPVLLARLHGVDVGDLVERLGPVSALVSMTNLVSLLRDRDPAQAVALAERLDPLARRVEEENVIGNYLHARLLAVQHLLGAFDGAGDVSTLDAARAVAQRAEADGWNEARTAGALLALANGSGPRDEEEAGLQLLDVVEQLVPAVRERHADSFIFLRTSLSAGAATNAFNSQRHEIAAAAYGKAIELALQLRMPRLATKWLDYFVDAAIAGGESSEFQALLLLFALGPRIETALGDDGAEQLQRLGMILTMRQTSADHTNADLLHLIWQVAKASAFASAISERAASTLSDDSWSERMLQEVAALRDEVPLTREGTGPGSRIDRMLRLLTFVRTETPSPGATPIERMTNLQHRFDVRLAQRLAQATPVRGVTPFGLEELRRTLEPRTAVLNLYLGPFKQGRARFAMLASRNALALHVTPDDSGLLLQLRDGAGTGDEHRTELGFSYAADAFALRQALAAPQPDAAAVADALEEASQWIIGGLASPLAEFRQAGCDHLCIVPHGPLHNLPLHLARVGSGMLADDWIVTVAPSLELLRRPARAEVPRHTDLSAFGLTFQGTNPYRLAALPEAADEATRVAEAFGTRATLEDAVTERAVREAFARSRYVHIATHGALNLDAPSFQYLVVTPSDGDDGLLYAHELLGADLRGVELITLSACETALGRVDRSDNPRGLAATLLLAGAEAIVGTLWETRSDVARAFFVALYRALRADGDRRAAFRAAQVETRRRFPDPWDWGAFYFLGAW